MIKPIYTRWSEKSNHIPDFPFALSLEKEATFDQVYKSSDWKKKILFQLTKLFGYTPQLAFQKEDVNMAIVEKMLEHKELLKVVDEWISETNHSLLDKLKEAKKVFEAIQPPPNQQLLYRGFKINLHQQNAGLDQCYKDMKPGDKWNHVPDKPMSFSWFKGTTSAYGNIVVSAEYSKNKNRCLHITHEMVMALFKADGDWNPSAEQYMFTYAESVFLPDGKPIEFTLVSKG